MSRRTKKKLLSSIELLERRALLSNTAPVANNDTFTGTEDNAITVSPGITSLQFTGNSSIYTGSHTWTEADGTFTGDGDSDYAHIHFQGTGATTDYWDLWFAPAPDGVLTTGTYSNAVRFLFQGPGQPGLDITGDGHSSDTVTGSFTINQYSYDESGNITSFYATFDHHANGLAAALDGTVEFHYMPPGFVSGVLANDTDADGDALTASVVSNPTHGDLVLNLDGSFNYIPDDDFNGTDSFTYRANDGQANSNTATVTLNVLSVNDQPTFTAGANPTINEDAGAQVINNWATSLNKGASDESGQTLSFIVNSDTNPGLFSTLPAIDSTGKLTYTAKANAWGVANVTIVLKDNGGTANGGVDTSDPVTFTITVNPVNDAPVAVNDTYSTPGNTAIIITPTSAQTKLTLNSQSGDPIGQGVSETLTTSQGTFGTSINNDNGVTVLFQGNGTNSTENWWLDFTNPGPSKLQVGTYLNATLYPFQADDQNGMRVAVNQRSPQSITGQFTIRQASYDSSGNVTHFAADFQQFANGQSAGLSGTVYFNYIQQVGVLSNDTDVDNDPLTATLVTGPTHGTLTLNSDGSFTYTPTTGYTGGDSFTYRANDGTTNSNTATVTLNVGATPPTVTTETPSSGATNVANNSTVTATFSTSVQSNTIVFQLRDSSNNLVPATVAYDANSKTATLTPTSQLAANMTYTASVSGAKDLNGVQMNGAVSWSFTTTFAYKNGTTLNVLFDSSGNHVFVRPGAGIVATLGLVSNTFSGISSVVVSGTSADNTLEFSGIVTATLTFNGGGGHDTINVNASNAPIVQDLGVAGANVSVNVQSSGTATFNTIQHLENLVITGGKAVMAAGTGTLYTGTLSLDSTAKLDLNDNDLVVNNGDFTAVQALVFQGYRQGADSSATGIISSTGQTAAGNPILAVFDNSVVHSADYPFGSGQTIGPNAVIGKYTYFGDTNLDGQVTADDYGALDANFGATLVDPRMAWIVGDTNFDGNVTADDYGTLDANFGQGTSNPLASAGTVSPTPLKTDDPAHSLLDEM